MIEITGHFGVINQRVIKAYTGDGDDFAWGSATSIDAAAAGSEIELEAYIPGSDSSYYIHLTSWDNAMDSAGAYLQEDKSGSRGTVSWPSSWNLLVDDGDDGVTADVEILYLRYATDDDHIYFQIETEADVTLSDSTFAILLNDVSDTGQTYETICHTRQPTVTARTYISKWVEGEWASRVGLGSSHLRVNNGGFSGVELACDSDSSTLGFTFAFGSDKAAAVSGDGDDDFFSGAWAEENTPTSGSGMDDITASIAVPEFSSLLMPIASVMLIVGYNYRSRRNSPLRT